jgi:hypothetical protein
MNNILKKDNDTDDDNINYDDINNILLNLKIISQIKENEKIITLNNNIEIDNRYFQSIYRWFSGDNRTISLTKIETVIDNAYNIIDCILINEDSLISHKINENNKFINTNNKNNKNTSDDLLSKSNSQLLTDFSFNLSNTIKGLDNLKITYKYDISINSKLEIIIDNMKDRINKIQNILKIKF